MTAAVEVDDPLVEQIARTIATKAAELWRLDGDHPWIATEAEKALPLVRATIAALKEMGRLLPEDAERRVQFSVTHGKERQVLDDGTRTPVGAQRWWTGAGIERRVVWETPWASTEAPSP